MSRMVVYNTTDGLIDWVTNCPSEAVEVQEIPSGSTYLLDDAWLFDTMLHKVDLGTLEPIAL